MLPWWGWVLLWAVIVLGGALLLWLLVRRTWRSFRALTVELGRAGALVGAVESEAATPNLTPPTPPRLDVFTSPAQAARERHEVRATLRRERQERREARLPGWARPLDWQGPE
jgi:hypothetical protein